MNSFLRHIPVDGPEQRSRADFGRTLCGRKAYVSDDPEMQVCMLCEKVKASRSATSFDRLAHAGNHVRGLHLTAPQVTELWADCEFRELVVRKARGGR